MEKVHYVTYATHDQGMFRELVNNPHGVEIKVLGWGEKWKGFGDKLIGVLEHIKTLPPDDYVVFLDGFDTRVLKPPDDIIQRFDSYGSPKILVSKSEHAAPTAYFTRKLFGACGEWMANAGMWMGRVGDAVEFIDMCKKHLAESGDDDQRAMNTVCRNYPQLKVVIDHRCVVFQNKGSGNCESSAIFCSRPGTGGGGVKGYIERRIIRGVREYAPFFKTEIFCLFVAIAVIYYVYKLQ